MPIPGNSIPTQQEQRTQLERLAAHRALLAKARRCLVTQLVLSVPCVIVLTIVATAFPSAKFVSSLWAVSLVAVNLFLLRWQKDFRERAAKVMEAFDVDVLQLGWNHAKVGPKPLPDAHPPLAAATGSDDKLLDEYKGWYPTVVGTVPIHVARLICQRMNCWWDARLRRDYSQWLLLGVVALALVILLICSVGGLTVDKMVVFASMLLPAISVAVTQHVEFRDSTEKFDKVVKTVGDALQKAANHASAADLTKEARAIQDEIYDLRRTSPVVFDCVYRRSRERDQKLAAAATEQLVADATKALGDDLVVRTAEIQQQLQTKLDAFAKHLREGPTADPSFAAAANDLLSRMLDEATGLAEQRVKYEVQGDSNVLFRSLTEARQCVRAVFCASEMNVVRLWTHHPMTIYLNTSGKAAGQCPDGFTRLFVFPPDFNPASEQDVETCVRVLDEQVRHKVNVYLHFTTRKTSWDAWDSDLVIVDDRRAHVYEPARKLANDYWWTTAYLSMNAAEVRRRTEQFEKGKLEALSWRDQREACISRLCSLIPVAPVVIKPKPNRRKDAQRNAKADGNGNPTV